MARARKEPIDAKKLSNWKLLDEFRRRLALAQARIRPAIHLTIIRGAPGRGI